MAPAGRRKGVTPWLGVSATARVVIAPRKMALSMCILGKELKSFVEVKNAV